MVDKLLRSGLVLSIALWVGTAFGVGLVVAPYLFVLAARQSDVVPDSGVAASLVGPLLAGVDWAGMAVAAGAFASLLVLRRRGYEAAGYLAEGCALVVLAASAANHWLVAPMLEQVQGWLADQYGSFHLADETDPLLAEFERLHGLSTGVFLAGLAGGLVLLLCVAHLGRRTDSLRVVGVERRPVGAVR